MKRKLLLVAVVALVAMSIAAPGVAAQVNETSNTTTTPTPSPNSTATPSETANETPTPTPTPAEGPATSSAGPYSIDELRSGGKSENIDTVKSVRALGEPPKGFVAARYRDPTLVNAVFGSEGPWKDVQPSSVVQQNRVQVYGSAFGEVAGEYEVVVVYWQQGTYETENGTPVQYAANQTVERHTLNLRQEDLYTFQNITLQQHLEQTWRVTMWLERDGQPVQDRDVQWTFRHRSNPESSAVSIDSQAEAWGFALRNAVLPGIASLIVGLIGARWTLRRTGRGPGYGLGAWLLVSGVASLVVGGIAYYQIAVILQNLPYVMGLSIGVVAYTAGLTFHQPVQKIGFLRRELKDVIRIPGGGAAARVSDGGVIEADSVSDFVSGDDNGAEIFDEFTEAMFLDLPEVPAVRTDDGYRVPVQGVKAFFARIFADAALLDLSSIATRQKVRKGNLSDIIITDPLIPDAIEHKAARLVRVLPWDTLGENPTWADKLIAAILTATIIIVPATIGYMALDRALNIGMVGAVIGVVVTIILSYSAEDGWIDFTPAPPHYVQAEDNLTVLQRAYQEAKEEQSAKEEAWDERARTAQEVRQERTRESRTITDRLFESMGADHAISDADGFEFDDDRDGDEDDEDEDEDEEP